MKNFCFKEHQPSKKTKITVNWLCLFWCIKTFFYYLAISHALRAPFKSHSEIGKKFSDTFLLIMVYVVAEDFKNYIHVDKHYMKSVRIRTFSAPIFSSVCTKEKHLNLHIQFTFIPNTVKYKPGKTLNSDAFYAM